MPNASHRLRADLRVGDLQSLLHDDSLLALLRDSGIPAERVVRNYIRLKPDVGALVGLKLWVRDGESKITELDGYLRTHEAERAAEIARKWHPERAVPTAIGPGVQLLKGGRTVLFVFPNDARVRGMRFIAEADKLKRILQDLASIGGEGWRIRARKTSLQTVRYKPERRLIVRAKLGLKNDTTGERTEREVFLRFFADDRGAQIARIRRSLERQPVGQFLPRLLGAVSEGRLFVEEAIKGDEILEDVRAGRANAQAVAETLVQLHASKVDGLPPLEPTGALASAEESVGNLIGAQPGLSNLLQDILARLRSQRPQPGPAVTLHGDCHLHQFLSSPRGPVLVDFERVALGNPMFDLGHLCAHLDILEADAADPAPIRRFRGDVLRHYEKGNPNADIGDLGFFVGCGLLERALLPFRRLEQDWPDRCRKLLELTLESLTRSFFNRPFGWDVFYPRANGDWSGLVAESYGVYQPESDSFKPSNPADDENLPGLRAWLSRARLESYRVGRRAILQAEDGRFVKLVRPRKAHELMRRIGVAQQLQQQETDFPALATLAASDPEQGVLVFEPLPGTPLQASLLTEEEPDLSAVARNLVAFHRPLAEGLPRAHTHAPLATWVGFLAAHDPTLHKAAKETLELCDTLPSGPFGPKNHLVHGDLHDGNILLSEQGIGILDLDLLGTGDPTADLGNLAAHLVWRSIQSKHSPEPGRKQATGFLNAYEGSGGKVHWDGVRAVSAHTLLRLACLYRFRRKWHHLCQDLLNEARVWAQGQF